jgi:hypothetical protein
MGLLILNLLGGGGGGGEKGGHREQENNKTGRRGVRKRCSLGEIKYGQGTGGKQRRHSRSQEEVIKEQGKDTGERKRRDKEMFARKDN